MSSSVRNLLARRLFALVAPLIMSGGFPGRAVAIELPETRQSAATQPRPTAATLTGRVLDPSGAVVPSASLTLVGGDGVTVVATTDDAGRFTMAAPAGDYRLLVTSPGFAPAEQTITMRRGAPIRVDVVLEVGGIAEAVQVVPSRLVAGPEASRRIPGSFDTLDLRGTEPSRIFTASEALRKVSGVIVREEEGFGLRPNIGIRGLNPTRSSRVLLLEDGIPLTYAPYGDNASYYHPPIERFEHVELLKGSGQIVYGPMTVGGVVNYVTPAPPARGSVSASAIAGSRGYFNSHASFGTTLRRTGILFDVMRKQGEGARENIHSTLHDVNGKVVARLSDAQVVTLRGSYYGEESNITYSGLREDEYLANPRENPFKNDFFYVDRFGASATHTYTLSNNVIVTTNVYASVFKRHWWRQSSSSSQRPNDAADPACGGMTNLNTTCGNEGRLRQYWVAGLEPRARVASQLGALWNETEIGLRVHVEDQERRQENGDTPTARRGRVVENNERQNGALAAFIQNRFVLGAWSITPGLRVERVGYARTNRLVDVSGRTDLVEVIPGIGVSHSPKPTLTIFAGAHRGFAPPRTEDIINNTTGGGVELDPELSWNYEAGVRSAPRPGLQFDATVFRMDYENQVVPATLAGGIGATLTNAGRTLHQGTEVTGRFDTAGFWRAPHNVSVRVAYTWLPTARFAGVRFSSVPGFGQVRVTANRLPYAPDRSLNASVGFSHAAGLDVTLEAAHVSEQFADDLNTVEPSPDGQRGLIPGHTVWNAGVHYRLRSGRATLFVAVKNLLDDTFIVDRSRGVLPGMPRLVHAGVKVRF